MPAGVTAGSACPYDLVTGTPRRFGPHHLAAGWQPRSRRAVGHVPGPFDGRLALALTDKQPGEPRWKIDQPEPGDMMIPVLCLRCRSVYDTTGCG